MVAGDSRDRWNARYADRSDVGGPAAFVEALAALVPPAAAVVDLAGGTGRHALFLARRGLAMTLIDISSVALETAAEAAREAGVELETIERDLEADGLPPGRTWDLALMHYYFDATVLHAAWEAVAPGGLLAMAQPTVVNLERHERPSRRFLLEAGQVEALAEDLATVAPLEVVTCTEGWQDNGRHEARLVVRRGADLGAS